MKFGVSSLGDGFKSCYCLIREFDDSTFWKFRFLPVCSISFWPLKKLFVFRTSPVFFCFLSPTYGSSLPCWDPLKSRLLSARFWSVLKAKESEKEESSAGLIKCLSIIFWKFFLLALLSSPEESRNAPYACAYASFAANCSTRGMLFMKSDIMKRL